MITKADYRQQATEASKLAELWRLAYVGCAEGKRPTAIHAYGSSEDGYTRVELHAPMHPCGGYVVITYCYPGQRDTVDVAYLDDWTHAQKTLDGKIAAERLNLARHEAIAAA